MSEELRNKFTETARQWIGVPYRHRGTTRSGCDCTGLVIGIATEHGFLINYKLRQYGRQWNLHAGAGDQMIEELGRFCDHIDNKEAGPGDIAVMRFGRCPAHCGIIIDDTGLIIHSLKSNKKVTCGMLRNSRWQKRWVMTFRINETKLNQYV